MPQFKLTYGQKKAVTLFCSVLGFFARVRLDLNSWDVWLQSEHVAFQVEVQWMIKFQLFYFVISIVAERLISFYGACRSFVIIHFWSVAIVVELKAFRVAPVLMDLPRLAVQAMWWKPFMRLWVMIDQIKNRSSWELRLAGVTKVSDLSSISVVSKSRMDCVWLRDVFGNVICCPRSIRAIVENILTVVTAHFTSKTRW